MPTIVDVSQPVLDYRGKPAKEASTNGEDPEPVLLRSLIFQALNTPTQGDARDDEHAYRRYKITAAVFADDEVSLSQKDVAFIIEQSGKVNPPLAHGRLRDVLDPPEPDGGDTPAGPDDPEGAAA